MIQVCAILVTFNRVKELQRAVQNVLRQTLPPVKLIIVDNGSHDATAQYLDYLQNRQDIHIILMKENTGCAGALAAGMQYAASLTGIQFIWVLDDDTEYPTNALATLIDKIHGTGYAMLGFSGAAIKRGKKRPLKNSQQLQEADYVMMDGAIIAVPAFTTAGIVDSRFFMMAEDHEYCLRLKKYGFKLAVWQTGIENRLFLGGGGSFTRASAWRGYYSARNHLLILKKYFSITALCAYLLLQSKLLLAAALLAPDRWQRTNLRLLGIWHGIRGKTGKTLDPETLQFIKPSPARNDYTPTLIMNEERFYEQ
ncbi:MAG TPA: glycosyltransferase [Chitinophagaceae bacterium]|nr:glycosyltransferase [Chitinophagaceae bacterium]